jgi:uncharacterized DUF497 family protein
MESNGAEDVRYFVFDEAKSRANKLKHGIDFVEAQALWDDDRLALTDGRSVAEARYIVVGSVAGKHWSAVVTFRGGAIRIISVRRSRNSEVTAYESGGFRPDLR